MYDEVNGSNLINTRHKYYVVIYHKVR